jgi:hypothetical protein
MTVPVSAIATVQPLITPSAWSSWWTDSGGSSDSGSMSASASHSGGRPGGVTTRRAPRSRSAAATAPGRWAARTRVTVAR